MGNLLRIDRFDTSAISGEVGITLVATTRGRTGTEVQIFGKGFGASVADNTVTFNGVPAAITKAAPNRLVVTVPSGATTGFITVTGPRGSGQSPGLFVVLDVVGPITITPPATAVLVNTTEPFTATMQDGTPAAVEWRVNNLPGGDAAIGTISADGLYRAPATVPNPAVVMVSAIHRDDRASTASADVTIIPPIAVAAVSVTLARPSLVVDKGVTASVSISVAPVITSVAPNTAAPGTTVTVTMASRGLSGATRLVFLRENATDSTITIANLLVSADGTQATADVTIDASAPLGDRVVHVVTPTGSSTRAGTGGNLFAVR
ncbi:MAG: IPT/TIG domain-containing protein [Candidatus Rokubacteria bacterium]|nr:IPT/TIG domain-containing protein [Candidatus Rokubacteria bacterium]